MRKTVSGFAFSAVAAAALEASAAALSLDPAPVVSVGLYKNGMAVVTRRITPGADGVALVDADARPAYGSFWLLSGGGVSVSSTKADVLREDVDIGFSEGWTGAYDGRKVEVTFRCGVGMEQILDAAGKTGSMKVLAGAAGESGRICTVRGTAVKEASQRADEPPNRPNRYYMPYCYEPPRPKPPKALNVRLESGSIVAVPESAVVSVRAEDGDSRGIAREMSVWRFDGAKAPFDVQYIATGACWTPSYRVDLAGGKGKLSMAAEVYNNIADWKDAEVSLISGFPNLLYADVPSLLGGGVDFGAYSSAIRAAEHDTYWGWFRCGGRNRGGVMSQSVMLNSLSPSDAASSFSAGAAEPAGAGTDIHQGRQADAAAWKRRGRDQAHRGMEPLGRPRRAREPAQRHRRGAPDGVGRRCVRQSVWIPDDHRADRDFRGRTRPWPVEDRMDKPRKRDVRQDHESAHGIGQIHRKPVRDGRREALGRARLAQGGRQGIVLRQEPPRRTGDRESEKDDLRRIGGRDGRQDARQARAAREPQPGARHDLGVRSGARRGKGVFDRILALAPALTTISILLRQFSSKAECALMQYISLEIIFPAFQVIDQSSTTSLQRGLVAALQRAVGMPPALGRGERRDRRLGVGRKIKTACPPEL